MSVTTEMIIGLAALLLAAVQLFLILPAWWVHKRSASARLDKIVSLEGDLSKQRQWTAQLMQELQRHGYGFEFQETSFGTRLHMNLPRNSGK